MLVGRHFEPGYRAGRLKQWLQFLRQRHPQAAEAYLRLRTITDSRAIAVGLFGVEKAQALELALAQLPARQRQAVVLRHLEGMSNPEIAAAMEIGVEAVESLTARGKRALAALLAGRREELGYGHD